MASDTIDIPSITNKFSDISHTWTKQHSFISGSSLVRTMADSEDASTNAASTEWVNRYFENKLPTTPTINVPLLTPMWFDHELTSNAWVRSEYTRDSSNDYGWLSGKTYDSIYSHLVLDLNDSVSTSETVSSIDGTSSVTITFKRSSDGHKIIETSNDTSNDDTAFSATGVSWYYVLDTTNRRFKLPRTRYGFQGMKSDNTNEYPGTYDKPGVPNITGHFDGNGDDGHIKTGAFYQESTKASGSNGTGSGTGYYIAIDASRCSDVYGSSSTVQPPATEMYLYFSTGDENSTGTGSGGSGVGGGVIDGTLLKGRTAVAVAAGAKSFRYTVENDCLLYIATTGADIEGWGNYSKDYLDIYVNSSPAGRLCDLMQSSSGDDDYPSCSIPVKKGSVITIKGDGTHACFGAATTVNFYEYELNSLVPQIAMPDWDQSKGVSISNGGTIPENGWIVFYLPWHASATTSKVFEVFVNGIEIGVSSSHVIGNYFNFQSYSVAAVSAGDIITYTTATNNSGVGVSVVFYPCKTVQQSNPPVYITKRDHGNYASLFNSSATYAIGDYYKKSVSGTTTYYRVTSAGTGSAAATTQVSVTDVPTWCYTLYSDGYCEQNGKMPYLVSQGSNIITVNLKQSFIDTNYTLIITAASSGYGTDDGHIVNEVQGARTENSFGLNVIDTNGATNNSYNCWRAEGFIW